MALLAYHLMPVMNFFAKEVFITTIKRKKLWESPVLAARRQANNNGYYNQVINWILLGDPTVIINRD